MKSKPIEKPHKEKKKIKDVKKPPRDEGRLGGHFHITNQSFLNTTISPEAIPIKKRAFWLL